MWNSCGMCASCKHSVRCTHQVTDPPTTAPALVLTQDFLSALASRTEPNPGPLEVIRRRQPKQAGPGVGATTFAAAEGPAGAEASEQGAEAQAEAEPAPAGDGAAGGGEEGTAAGGGAGAGGAGGGGNDAPLSVMALGRELEGYVDKDSLLIADTGAPQAIEVPTICATVRAARTPACALGNYCSTPQAPYTVVPAR